MLSKEVKRSSSSKYLIGYLDEVIRSLVLMLPKKSGYVKTFKIKLEIRIRIRIIN